MTVAFQRMFGILERWNNNQVMPSLSKPHELSYRSNISLQVKFAQIRLHCFGLLLSIPYPLMAVLRKT